MVKKDIRKLGNIAIEHLRFQVVAFLKEGRGTQADAAQVFGTSLRFVNKVWGIYKQQGTKGLRLKARGLNKATAGGLLSTESTKIKRLVVKATPDVYQLPYFLWTSGAVKMLIEKETGRSYGTRHVRRLLKQWGFTAQKPVYKAYEQDPKAVKQWLESGYRIIKKKAKRQKGIILWADETGMRSDHQAGRSYAPKGKTPVIKRTGQRFGVNMISALSNKGELSFKLREGSVNSEVFIRFMKQLIKAYTQKVFLIVDGHPVHKTKKVKEWLQQNSEWIEVHLLPAYSPELNPDEYLNQDIKTNVIGKSRPKNKKDLKAMVQAFMKKRKRQPEQVKKYFHADPIMYAA